jgi:hypothetical protein
LRCLLIRSITDNVSVPVGVRVGKINAPLAMLFDHECHVAPPLLVVSLFATLIEQSVPTIYRLPDIAGANSQKTITMCSRH